MDGWMSCIDFSSVNPIVQNEPNLDKSLPTRYEMNQIVVKMNSYTPNKSDHLLRLSVDVLT